MEHRTILEMAADGTIDRIKSRYATLKCASDDSATTISYQLGIEQTVGIVVAGAALMIFVLVAWRRLKMYCSTGNREWKRRCEVNPIAKWRKMLPHL